MVVVKAPELKQHKLVKGIEARINQILTYNEIIDVRSKEIEENLEKNDRDIKEMEKLFSQLDALLEKLGKEI